MFKSGDLTCPFHLDTWKILTSKYKPCVAGIRVGQTKMSDNELFAEFAELRAAKNPDKTAIVMKDYISILSHAVNGGPVEDVVVTTEPATPAEKSEVVPADF